MPVLLRKIGVGAGIFLLGLIVLIVLLYLEEDWRGARDWADCQKQLVAKGEILDLRTLAPPGKPEDDLSKVPIFAEEYRKKDSSERTRLDQINSHLGYEGGVVHFPKGADFRKGKAIDLSAWQNFYRSIPQAHLPAKEGTPAEDVLQALAPFQPQLDEVQKAVSQPNAFFPLNYNLPMTDAVYPVVAMLQVAKVFPLKAVAHLENHQSDLAEKDYLFALDINRPLTRNCLLIGCLVAVANRTIDDAILWEGIRRHAWSNPQLQEMDSALAETDMLALERNTLRNERAAMLQMMGRAQMRDSELRRQEEMLEAGTWTLLQARPEGWWDQDRKKYSLFIQDQIESIHPAQGTMTMLDLQQPLREKVARFFSFLITPLSDAALPGFSEFGPRMAEAETNNRLARLACRLEEYYLAHGEYPAELGDLPDLPPHLNQEVLTGRPMHYQQKGAGYSLYSTGWDETDHGGSPRMNTDNKDDYDWVWPSP